MANGGLGNRQGSFDSNCGYVKHALLNCKTSFNQQEGGSAGPFQVLNLMTRHSFGDRCVPETLVAHLANDHAAHTFLSGGNFFIGQDG